MKSETLTVLERLYAEDDQQRKLGLPVEQRTRNLTRVSGEYLALLTRATGARRVLEVGSSNGVSTIWFASALADSGGFVTGTELIPARAAEANANIVAAGLAEFGHVVAGDAAATIAGLEETFDIVFIDAEKDDYVDHFNAVWPKVRVGGLILADNVMSHDISTYQQMVRGRSDCDTVTLTLERGIEMTIRRA